MKFIRSACAALEQQVIQLIRLTAFLLAALGLGSLAAGPAQAAGHSARVSIERGSDSEFMQGMAEQQGQQMPQDYKQQKDKRSGTLSWEGDWLRLDIVGGKGRPGGSWLYDSSTRSLYELNRKKKTYFLTQLPELSGGIGGGELGQSPEWLILRWAEFYSLEEDSPFSIAELGSDEMEGYDVSGMAISGSGGLPEIPGGIAGMQGMEGMEGLKDEDIAGLQGMFDMLGKMELTIWASEELEIPLSFAFTNMGMETVLTLSEIEDLEDSALLSLPEDYTLEERNPDEPPYGS